MSRTPRLNRRSFFTRVMGAALGAGAASAGAAAHAITDSDPTDRAYQGGGCIADSDPTDRARCGGRAGAGTRPIGFVLLVVGVGAAAAGAYMRRKRD